MSTNTRQQSDRSRQTAAKFKLNGHIKEVLESAGVDAKAKEKILARGWISCKDLQSLLSASLPSQSARGPGTKDQEHNESQPSAEDTIEGTTPNQHRVDYNKLLQSLEFYFPPKPKAEKSPEFIRTMNRLRVLEEERAYQELIHRDRATIYDKTLAIHKSTKLNLNGASGDEEDEERALSPSQFNKQVKEQLTTVVNVLVTGGSVAFAAWYWSGSSMGAKLSTRVFLSLVFGVFVMVAEIVVYNGYLRRMEEAKKKERRKKEVRKVIETVTITKHFAGELEEEKEQTE